MKRQCFLVLIFMMIFCLCSCEFSGSESKKTEFDFETINWNAEIKEIDDTYDEASANQINSLLSKQEGFYHTCLRDFKSIKNVMKSDVKVMYNFGEDKKLKQIDILIESCEQETIDNILKLSEKNAMDLDEANYKTYILYINESKIKMICNFEKNGIIIEATQSSDADDSNVSEGLVYDFSIKDINWTALRDDIKNIYSNKICRLDEKNEEMAPLGYTFDKLKDISDVQSDVIFYFNNDNLIKSVFILFDYDEETLINTLKYFDISPDIAKTQWQTSSEDAEILVKLDKASNEIEVFLYNKKVSR